MYALYSFRYENQQIFTLHGRRRELGGPTAIEIQLLDSSLKNADYAFNF